MNERLGKITGMKPLGSNLDYNPHSVRKGVEVDKVDTEAAGRKVRKFAGE